MIVPLLDTEEEKIIPHFEKTCEFIRKALSEGGKVLVHWFFLNNSE